MEVIKINDYCTLLYGFKKIVSKAKQKKTLKQSNIQLLMYD